jgi:hypothetical protein
MTNKQRRKQKYNAKYVASHHEEIAKQQAEYRTMHSKHLTDKRVANRKVIAKRDAKYYAKNAAHINTKRAKYRAVHRVEIAWKNMHYRCAHPIGHYNTYEDVRVCRRWSGPKGQANFIADMGPRPAGTSLSRFGDIGNYGPSNCAWHTWAQQREEQRKKLHLKVPAKK